MTETTHGKYPFLAELGIKSENFGALVDGKWGSTG